MDICNITYVPRLSFGDNLSMMGIIPAEQIDLIVADPFYDNPPNADDVIEAARIIGSKWEYKPIYYLLLGLDIERDSVEKSIIKSNLAFLIPRLIEMYRVLKPTGSIYIHCKPKISHYLKIIMDTIFGIENFRNEIIWCSPPAGNGPKLGYHRRHDTILFYGKSEEGIFNRPYTDIPEQTIKAYSQIDTKERNFKNFGYGRSYLDEKPGRPVPSWWTDISPFSVASNSKERLGYPNQKPYALYERMIKASSNKGDLILDPFCGTGTVLDVAQHLKRDWVGMDTNQEAIEIVMKRLGAKYGLVPHEDYFIEGENIDNLNMPDYISPMQLEF